ncbi:MAG: PhzF family phenazine biosynthesis protein, partial [Dehalococcoidia bacterium]
GAAPALPLHYADLVGEDTPIAIFDTEADVRARAPDLAALTKIGHGLLVVTAPADDPAIDFVSRFFAPGGGIDEDPVTGSTHCALTPWWADRLGKTTLRARQVSRRSGDLLCELRADRVRISGHCVTVIEGSLHVAQKVAQVSDL